MAVLENTQEVGDEEAPEHKAHGQQSSVGVGWWCMFNVSGGFVVHVVEGVSTAAVQLDVVQDQRVGFEDLPWPEEETVSDCICEAHESKTCVIMAAW